MKTYRSKKMTLSILAVPLVLMILGAYAFGETLSDQGRSHGKRHIEDAIIDQEEITPDVMSMTDVLGTAVGIDDSGEPMVLVFMNLEGQNPAENAQNVPRHMRGKSHRIEFTEPFRSFAKASPVATSSVSHTVSQTLPIQLGTSGGWGYDLANGYCCGGTLGSLIKINGIQYILSNYHVFESDIDLGGNDIIAQSGNPIIHPGLIDVDCNFNSARIVATLVKKSSLPYSNVDASIAAIASGMVRTDGAILEIGTISWTTVAARLKQAVKKSGRTTGLTRSSVSGLNATISVTYEDECAGSTAFTKTFKNQIIVKNPGSTFLAGGDSGSLMVEDITTKPRAVGLLFAGSSTLAVANPIKEVLTYFGATMVGK